MLREGHYHAVPPFLFWREQATDQVANPSAEFILSKVEGLRTNLTYRGILDGKYTHPIGP